jgi:hypothetical protein
MAASTGPTRPGGAQAGENRAGGSRGSVRSYYRAMQAGRKRFEELASSFKKTVGAVRLVLEGGRVSD